MMDLDHVEHPQSITEVETGNEDLSQTRSDYYAEGDISSLILRYEEEPEVVPQIQPAPEAGSSVLGKRKGSLDTDERTKKSAKSRFTATVDPDEPYFIAYSPTVQDIMDHRKLAFGVQHELARLITSKKITYSDITADKVDELQGLNAVATSNIAKLFSKAGSTTDSDDDPAFAQEKAANSPWKELDKEEEVLSRNPMGGLGNNPAYPDWYGGKTEFRGRLVETHDKTLPYRIILDPCTLGQSSRFARRFGSWSFLRVKIQETIFYNSGNNLEAFFRKAFVIWDRVFRACYAKDDNIFFFWTNETFPSRGPVPNRFSLEEFIMWHNSLTANSKQLMTKWAARTVLGFSNSIPGPLILPENIILTHDIVSDENSEMTDGCGLSTRSVHRSVLKRIPNLASLPTAFQFRLGGCKGMSLLSDEGEFKDEKHRVWIRPSQTKIKYLETANIDQAMLTIDLLRASHMSSPSKLSSEMIINLAENNVPHKVFADLLKASITELVKGLTTWEGQDAMYELWKNVERAGGVLASRRAREARGEARVRGYTNRSPEEEELEEEEADEDGFIVSSGFAPRSTAWWADAISGCPSSLEETVMVLLDSGFMPQTCPVLREKLKKVVCTRIENRTHNLRFELNQSCTAFAVPDPFNVLGPNEIQIKSSSRNLHTNEDDLLSDVILGEVLIGRNPCKVPSDIRKVRAVEHPCLRNLVDVIVFSTQGHRRLIDFLAGGDYDGDKVLVMWAPLLVSDFKNADEKFSYEPPGVEHCFTRENETGDHFLERTRTMEESARRHAMQKYLLGALVDPSLLGKYSGLHQNAIYSLGYAHPRTSKIAYKFARVMDGSKTGYRIKPESYQADQRQYGHPHGPQWLAISKKGKGKKKRTEKPKIDTTNISFLQRKMESDYIRGRKFVMDSLLATAERERDRLLNAMETIFAPLGNQPDSDLTAPWNLAVAWADRKDEDSDFSKVKRKDLALICQHVKKMYMKHKTLLVNKGGSFTKLPIEKRQDGLRSLSKEFASGPDISELRTIADPATLARYRASYAYVYDAEQNVARDGTQGWSRFPWNVALRELCAIKAAAQGPYKVVTNNFYERFRMVKNH